MNDKRFIPDDGQLTDKGIIDEMLQHDQIIDKQLITAGINQMKPGGRQESIFVERSENNKKCNTLGSGYALDSFLVEASVDALGFLLAAGGLLTTSDTHSQTH